MMKNVIRSTALNLAAIAVGIILCELVLMLASLLSPAVAYRLSPYEVKVSLFGVEVMVPREVIPDPFLGFRFSPYAPGNDAWGYRNARVPNHCDVVAIGDSMTFGNAARAEEAWPRVLERLTGHCVYNAGISGYGPPEYQIVLEEAMRLRPRTVVVGLYLGNDIWEAFRTVYVDKRGPRFAHLQNQDPEQLAAIQAKTDFASLRATAAQLRGEDVLASFARPPGRSVLRSWVSAHSSTYGLLREIRHTLDALWKGVKDDSPPEVYVESFDESAKHPQRLGWDGDARFKTVFLNPAYDLMAVDRDDLRVRDGLRITQEILREMSERLATEHISFIVAVIPSKQTVYAELIAKHGPKLPDMERYLESEAVLKAEMTSFFKAHAIRHVDVLPALRGELARGSAPYHQGEESHPNASGYEAIANTLLPALRELSPK